MRECVRLIVTVCYSLKCKESACSTLCATDRMRTAGLWSWVLSFSFCTKGVQSAAALYSILSPSFSIVQPAPFLSVCDSPLLAFLSPLSHLCHPSPCSSYPLIFTYVTPIGCQEMCVYTALFHETGGNFITGFYNLWHIFLEQDWRMTIKKCLFFHSNRFSVSSCFELAYYFRYIVCLLT